MVTAHYEEHKLRFMFTGDTLVLTTSAHMFGQIEMS